MGTGKCTESGNLGTGRWDVILFRMGSQNRLFARELGSVLSLASNNFGNWELGCKQNYIRKFLKIMESNRHGRGN